MKNIGLISSEKKTRILAIDVGMGTQDILLFDNRKNPENNIKIVLPSATRIMARKVFNSHKNLFIRGETMGGGPFGFAVQKHIEKGMKVWMTKNAARSLRDDLDQVRGMGIEIVDNNFEPPEDAQTLITMDFDLQLIKNLLEGIEEGFSFDFIGIGVQDHGRAPKGVSDRKFRFEKIKELIEKSPNMYDLGFIHPPEYFTRMGGAERTLEKDFPGKGFFVDSKIAAMVGALHCMEERPVISLDIGNGHTTAFFVGEKDEILGVFEHHTGLLTREKLEDYMARFAKGQVTNEEVYDDNGHGCHIGKCVRDVGEIKRIMVTGPRRGLLEGSKLNVEFANPAGDVMMTGTMGIIDMILQGEKNKISPR